MKIYDVLRSGYKNPDYNNYNMFELIENNKDKIFKYDYPINPVIKDDFEKAFCLHYFRYELSPSLFPMAQWHTELYARLYNLFPLYNQYFNKMSAEINGNKVTTFKEIYERNTTANREHNDTDKFTQDVSRETEVNNKNRDFPISAISNTDAYLTDSQDNNETENANRQDNRNRKLTEDSTNKEEFSHTTEEIKGISDLDYLKLFRSQLQGIYNEIFKELNTLFVLVL